VDLLDNAAALPTTPPGQQQQRTFDVLRNQDIFYVLLTGFSHLDCCGASVREGLDCRAAGRTARAFSALDGGPAVALDVELEDLRVVDEAIDGGQRHGGIREDTVPFSEGLVRSDQDGSPLVAGADQLEEHAGLGLVLGDVGEVVED
jgi:hypothetical protein